MEARCLIGRTARCHDNMGEPTRKQSRRVNEQETICFVQVLLQSVDFGCQIEKKWLYRPVNLSISEQLTECRVIELLSGCHLAGFLMVVWLTGFMMKANEVIRRETALKVKPLLLLS
jgi:hypothetical protein